MTKVILIAITLACVSLAAHAQEPSARLGQDRSTAPSFASEDPTERTVTTILREIQQLEQRMLDKIDALALKQSDFEERIEGFPTETQQAISKFDELMIERLATVNQRFENIQNRLEAVSKAIEVSDKNRTENIDIALTAQQDAVAKAAGVTAEQIQNINAVQQAEKQVLVTDISGVKSGQNDLKDRLTAMENRLAGAVEQRSTSQDYVSMWIGWVVGAIGLGIALFRTFGTPSQPTQREVVYVQPPAPNGPSKA